MASKRTIVLQFLLNAFVVQGCKDVNIPLRFFTIWTPAGLDHSNSAVCTHTLVVMILLQWGNVSNRFARLIILSVGLKQ